MESRSADTQENPAQQGDLEKLYVGSHVVQESRVMCESRRGVGWQAGNKTHPTLRTEPQDNRLRLRRYKPFLGRGSFKGLTATVRSSLQG